MQLKGQIKEIKDVEIISEKFRKQIVLVEQETKFDAVVPIEFVNQKIDNVVPELKVGQNKTFLINIQGREWNGKYFVSLRCFGVHSVQMEKALAEGNEQEQNGDLPF
jgi:hypothetical protein